MAAPGSEVPGIQLYAVGDIAPDRADPRECFRWTRDVLRAADVAFCQLEVNLTTRGVRLPQVRHTHRAPASTARALKDAGFSVVSFAGNHCLDWGPDGFDDTVAALRGAGLEVVGVGLDISEARAPVIVEREGVRVAFLAYSSILPAQYWAETNRRGCAPMRAFTVYEQIEPDQPGTPARVHTYADRGDLAALRTDVAAAKQRADLVIVSLHWGIHFVPAVIADYQREVGHAAIDAGADLILGHHAHILKGVEVYRDKAIFYSLGNFAMDLRMDEAHAQSKGFKEIQALHPDWVPDFDSLYNFPPESRMTMIVRALLTRQGIADLGFLPAYIDREAQPEVVRAQDPRFKEITRYMECISASQNLSVQYEPVGDEVRVHAGLQRMHTGRPTAG
ncbi:MAG TPA: CapA family protein [Polyangiales bacterium]|nr:CapA family protein [Polyangiales bacterium]